MSTVYILEEQINFEELLDGRLEPYGIYEEYREGYTSEHLRVLSDGSNFLWVYGKQTVESMTRYGSNAVEHILGVISKVFDTEIISEYDPQFWGFKTIEEQDQAELLKAKTYRRHWYEQMMNFAMDRPHKLKPGTDEFEDAEIVKELVAENLEWADPNLRDELFVAVHRRRMRPTPSVPDGPHGDLIRAILMKDTGKLSDEIKDTFHQVSERLD